MTPNQAYEKNSRFVSTPTEQL